MSEKLSELLKYPARMRRSMGFGIHSPFAFNLITKVIREKEAVYYAYAEIAAFCPKARRAGFNEIFAGLDLSIPEAQLIFRLLCHFNPAHIIECGHGHEVTGIIFSRAVPNAEVHYWNFSDSEIEPLEGEPLVLVNRRAAGKTEVLGEALSGLMAKQDIVVVVRNLHYVEDNRRLWEKLMNFKEFGMSFTDGYMGIFVARRSLPRQDYDLFF